MPAMEFHDPPFSSILKLRERQFDLLFELDKQKEDQVRGYDMTVAECKTL
jgi:hypothetical protein